ncbi:ABC transporter substrate-binding protein [Superficieibacter sp.]|uniref:ABC transporter substrate-binding protein n=1 Tax=Superficieibacter sp. TaxID=2303322 RepID=UPI0028AFEF7D|nr:ABC transporter substrate-binding protein [Superficieibacter sp.]
MITASYSHFAQAKEVVNFWARSDQSALPMLVSEYNKSQDKVTVKLNEIPNAQMLTKLSSAIGVGNPPDIVAIDLVYFPELNRSEQLVDLTEKIGKMDYVSQFSPTLKGIGTYNGKFYAVPFAAESALLFYNKKLFREAGLDPNHPPETLAELREYSEKIRQLGNEYYGLSIPGTSSGGLAFTFMPYLWANGGSVISSDGKKSVVNSENNKRTLTFFHNMYKDGLMSPMSRLDASLNDYFASGKIAMVGSGAFTFKVFKEQYPNLEYGVTYFPGEKKGDWASFTGGDAFALPVGSKHQDEAIDFINWTLSKNTQVELLAKNGFVPTRMDASDNPYSQQDPKYLLANKALAKGYIPFLVPYNETFNATNSPWLTMLQKSIFDGDIDGALKTADQKINQIIKMAEE